MKADKYWPNEGEIREFGEINMSKLQLNDSYKINICSVGLKLSLMSLCKVCKNIL